MKKEVNSALVEKINMLGPWVHGYFNLPCGITIKDTDEFQRERLFYLRDQFIDIIQDHFGRTKLLDKEILDIGCNAGYFLFELYKHFEFKSAKGIDPKKSNIDKAKFIASQFKLPKSKYSVSIGNLFKLKKKLYDVVIMPGVFHHLDDHLIACKHLYEMTGEVLILETMALPDEVENHSMAEFLELKDGVYKNSSAIFGVTGHKLESEYLDGATASSGIVSIPSKNSVYLSLFNAGFRDIKLISAQVPFDSLEEKKAQKYSDFHSVIAVAVKPKLIVGVDSFFEDKTRTAQQAEIDVVVPISVIEPLYMMITGHSHVVDSTGEAKLTYLYILRNVENAACEVLKGKAYYGILRSLMHSPLDKIRLEYAKSLYKSGENAKAKEILNTITKTVNCDWRSVYRAYHLLSLISLADGNVSKARINNSKALRTHPNFFPAINLREEIRRRS